MSSFSLKLCHRFNNREQDLSCPILLVTILVFYKSGYRFAVVRFFSITRMITDRIGFHSDLLPLLIITITISSSVIGALVSLFSLIILDCDWFKNSSLH